MLILAKHTNETNSAFYITDKTVWDGIDAPLRTSVVLLAYAIYRPSTGDVAYPIVDYLPEDVVTFTLDVTGHDGRYTVYIFELNRYTSGILADGDIVFDMNDRKIKKQSGTTVNELQIPDLINEESVSKSIADTFFVTEGSKRLNELELIALQKLEASLESRCEIDEYEQALTNYNYVRLLIKTSRLAYCRGLYASAAERIEKAIKFADTIINV